MSKFGCLCLPVWIVLFKSCCSWAWEKYSQIRGSVTQLFPWRISVAVYVGCCRWIKVSFITWGVGVCSVFIMTHRQLCCERCWFTSFISLDDFVIDCCFISNYSCPIFSRLPDSSSDKENSHSRFALSSHRPLLRHADAQSEVPTPAPPAQRRFDYVELSPVPASSSPLPASQREAGEGQGREHSQWQEERNTSSQWEALLSRKGTGVGSNQRLRPEDEIEKKWAEFERMPLKEMSSMPPMGSRPSGQSANEALQREVVCGDLFPICKWNKMQMNSSSVRMK